MLKAYYYFFLNHKVHLNSENLTQICEICNQEK